MREDEEQSSKVRFGGPAAALPGLAMGMDLLAFARYLQSESDAPVPRSEASQVRTSVEEGTEEALRADSLERVDPHQDAAAAASESYAFASFAERSSPVSITSNGGTTQVITAGVGAPLSVGEIIKMIGTLSNIWNVASSPMPDLHTASLETGAWFSSRISVPQPSTAASTAQSPARSSNEVGHLVAKSDLSTVASCSTVTSTEESEDTDGFSASAIKTNPHNASSAPNLQVTSANSTSTSDPMRLYSPSVSSVFVTKSAANQHDKSAVAGSPPITDIVEFDSGFGFKNAGLAFSDITKKSIQDADLPVASLSVSQAEPAAQVPTVDPAPPSETVPLSTPAAPDGDLSTGGSGSEIIPAAAEAPTPPIILPEDGTVPPPRLSYQTIVEVSGETSQPPALDAPPDEGNVHQLVVPKQAGIRGIPADEPISNFDMEYPLPGPGPSPGFAASLLAHLNESLILTLENPPIHNPAASDDNFPLASEAVAPDSDLNAETIVGFSADDLPPPHSMFAALHETSFSTTLLIYNLGISIDT